MEKILDKFLRYVSVETTSDENSENQPSTAIQLNLLKLLRNELCTMGILVAGSSLIPCIDIIFLHT